KPRILAWPELCGRRARRRLYRRAGIFWHTHANRAARRYDRGWRPAPFRGDHRCEARHRGYRPGRLPRRRNTRPRTLADPTRWQAEVGRIAARGCAGHADALRRSGWTRKKHFGVGGLARAAWRLDPRAADRPRNRHRQTHEPVTPRLHP